ncbi:MAG: OadG family protein [Calditrichaeota bacterium]|nr:OadG family protein [Calditrichota bacterium]RQV92518.1 MAG: hypothetical protein EH221_11270 [bacterium]
MLFINLSAFYQIITGWDTIVQRMESGHGLLVTAIGLSSVFLGLIILWIITANLKKIIEFFEKILWRIKIYTGKEKSTSLQEEGSEEETTEEEIAAAIATALHLELEEEEVSVLTLRHIEQEMSPWVVASRPATMRRQR